MNDSPVRRQEVEAQLKLLHEELEQQMRARGFDPAQADNVALPAELAQLYGEYLVLKEQLEAVKRDDQ